MELNYNYKCNYFYPELLKGYLLDFRILKKPIILKLS